jgi:hypothetical protein
MVWNGAIESRAAASAGAAGQDVVVFGGGGKAKTAPGC